MNTALLIKKCKSLYRRKLSFDKVEYVDEFTPVIVTCTVHNVDYRVLPCHLLEGDRNGLFVCPLCRRDNSPAHAYIKNNLKDLLKKARQKHGSRYDYSHISDYVGIDAPIAVYCKKCKCWKITSWYKHLTYGCICNKRNAAVQRNKAAVLLNKKAFKEAIERNANFKVFGKEYTGFLDKVHLKCKRCGTDKYVIQQYFIHKDIQKCVVCDRVGKASFMGLDFINLISKKTRLKFIPEYQIDNLFVDGFNKKYGIVLEFYGDYFHGNLKLFSPRKRCCFTSTKTAYMLNKNTKLREQQLKKLGYNVFYIWEYDWNYNRPHCVNSIVKAINKLRERKC